MPVAPYTPNTPITPNTPVTPVTPVASGTPVVPGKHVAPITSVTPVVLVTPEMPDIYALYAYGTSCPLFGFGILFSSSDTWLICHTLWFWDGVYAHLRHAPKTSDMLGASCLLFHF